MTVKPLPKGAIVTGRLHGVVPLSAMLHPGCLWLLISRGSKSKQSEIGYVQDIRCLRHSTVYYDVDGSFLRERAEKTQVEQLLKSLKTERVKLRENIKFLETKLTNFVQF